MIPFSLSWDTQKRSIFIKWDGFFSFGREKGKTLMKILGFPIRFRYRQKEIHFPMRWVYLKEAFFGKIPDLMEKAVNIIKGKKKGEGT
jgi:hypothetical protein